MVAQFTDNTHQKGEEGQPNERKYDHKQELFRGGAALFTVAHSGDDLDVPVQRKDVELVNGAEFMALFINPWLNALFIAFVVAFVGTSYQNPDAGQ